MHPFPSPVLGKWGFPNSAWRVQGPLIMILSRPRLDGSMLGLSRARVAGISPRSYPVGLGEVHTVPRLNLGPCTKRLVPQTTGLSFKPLPLAFCLFVLWGGGAYPVVFVKATAQHSTVLRDHAWHCSGNGSGWN